MSLEALTACVGTSLLGSIAGHANIDEGPLDLPAQAGKDLARRKASTAAGWSSAAL
jgi:hypothetical protein